MIYVSYDISLLIKIIPQENVPWYISNVPWYISNVPLYTVKYNGTFHIS